MRLVAGHFVAERYEIDSILGSGGMAVVYRAFDLKLNRYVTLKVLKEDYVNDENLMRRFPDEARAAAQLNHQNIVKIFDHGQDGDVVFIVLEYIEGNNLKEHINRMAPFDDETCLGVAIQIAEGLREAHASGIIHLDIKPQNILVTTNGTVKVTDFGIARVARDVTLKAGGGSMGSVHYFSPEQARGGYIDHKSDIYSLGIVLFEMVTGHVPFDGENEVAVAMQQINNPLPDILSINPNVSASLVNIINKACEKSASQRYASTADMAIDLKRAMSGLGSLSANANVDGAFEEYDDLEEYEEDYYEPEPPPPPPPRIENKRQVQRKRERMAFLDNEAPPLDYEDDYYGAPPPNIRGGILKQDQNLGVINKSKKKSVPVYTDADKKSDKAAVYLGIVGGIIFMALILVAVFWGYNRFFGGVGGSRTPNLIGQSLHDARDLARSYGFELQEGGAEYHPYHPFDHVIHQVPGPNINLAPGLAIMVTLSRGPQEVVVMENLIGLLGSDAYDMYRAMDRMDFGIWLLQEYSDLVPIGHVITQDPPEGTSLVHGDSITLIVSLGPMGGFVAVPDIVGMTLEEALTALRDANLVAREQERQYRPDLPDGTIISQNPEAGEDAIRESDVFFVISTDEPDEEVVPTPTPAPTPTPEPEETPEPSPAASPIPVPSPPVSQDTPAQDPTPAVPTTRVVRIPLYFVPEGADHVYISINRQDEGAGAVPFAQRFRVYVREFPFELRPEGTGVSTFTVLFFDNGSPVRSYVAEVDFGASG